jgi:phosphate uptake regulator
MPHEETRKIIKVGETSYAVILPKSWLRYYGLDDKDHVKVISNSTVVIKPRNVEEKEPQASE